jgi:hypothetical protein
VSLTIEQIRDAQSNADLLRLLQSELNFLFPPESRRDVPVFLSKLQTVPVGMRAMAATFELDVSMALDELAWHFVNYPHLDWYEETRQGLRELEANEAAELFEKAFSIVEPHWNELGEVAKREDFSAIHDWLNKAGIQMQIDPLNDRMWKLLGQWPDTGLMQYWIIYSRKYPERCVNALS